jgi:hypothetical protein
MALYLVLRDDGQDNVLHVYKCTGDPETPANWVAQDSHGFPGPIKTISSVVQDSDIHIAVAGIGGVRAYVHYCKFDPGTDAFTVTGEVADNGDCNYDGLINPGDVTTCCIAVRSDGDVIIGYLDTSQYPVYSRREGSSWTRSVSFYSTSSRTVACCLGISDRTHFFIQNDSANILHRSLSYCVGLFPHNRWCGCIQ